MAARLSLKKCYGWNSRTNKKVGERHRWSGDVSGPGWGKGTCIWCHRDLQQLADKPEQEMTLEFAIARGVEEGAADEWFPKFEPGRFGTAKGWYISRGPRWSPQWMHDADGNLIRCDTEAQARAAILAACATSDSSK